MTQEGHVARSEETRDVGLEPDRWGDLTLTGMPTWLPGGWRPQSVPDAGFAGELRARQQRLHRAVQADYDGIVTVKQPNIRYLTGYSTIAAGKAALLVTRDGAYLAVSESELGRALMAPGVRGVHVFGWDEPVDIERWLRHSPYGSELRRVLCEWGEEVRAGDGGGQEGRGTRADVIDIQRLVTSEWEASCIRQAARATRAGVEAAVDKAGDDGTTDSQIAATSIAAMISESGYECPPIAVVGIDEGAGIPHSQWGRRSLQPGSVAFIELSGGYDGYCAPVMRTIVRDPVPKDVVDLFSHVESILDILCNSIKPGVRCSDVARKCSGVLSDINGVLFHYNYGYPVGIFDGTPTWMNGAEFYITTDNEGIFEPGMTFHLPISLRRFGQYAVGQSQTVRVTDEGVEVMTGDVPSGLLHAPVQ
ncbi:Xaa-Pro peptidase family protein [Saccharomonospora sp. NPDC046836]|uniref:M24 family metallopeptidase n=1 Tax=Saccharomonospora sp. NPDC046836 TaxID=3156921 RepID=UPI0033FCE03E